VISGQTYFARDRSPIEPDEVDRTSGGSIRPLPSRTAALAADGSPPEYAATGPDGGPEALESELERFLEATQGGVGSRHEELPDGAPEHLRALGYLE
jgi:hypothetical protein